MTGPRLRRGPVQRRMILAGSVGLLAAVLGLVGIAETLRHPDPGLPTPDFAVTDPRVPPDCPLPPPAEGETRAPEPAAPGPPVQVTSGDLLDCPSLWDGRNVRLRGEAVGALMRRGEVAWVQVNDDVYAEAVGPLPAHRFYQGGNSGVGVQLSARTAEQITVIGGPGVQGDVVEVIGRFARVDDASGEIAVVIASQVEVLRPGQRAQEEPLRDRRVVAYALSGLALAFVGYARRRDRAS